jgi:sarcosine oxidase subunit gamma
MAEIAGLEQAPFAGICATGRYGRRTGSAGVVVREVRDATIATVIGRRGQTRALADKVRQEFGIELPEGPRRVGNRDFSFTWSGPARWRVMRPGGASAQFERELVQALAGLATVVEQTHGLAILHLSGPKVRDALVKGFAIDLHLRAFAAGRTAVTTVSHIAVQITQLSAEPVFEVAVARSLAGSFWHWLEASAAEFGLEVPAPSQVRALE